MRILVNASNLYFGGGMQVTDSFCSILDRYIDDTFVVVLPPFMKSVKDKIIGFENVKVIDYQFVNNYKSILFSRDAFLDTLVIEENVDFVFTIFAPSWWTPRIPHLCGFALAHLVMPESPYFTQMPWFRRIKEYIQNKVLSFYFWRCSDYFYTENPIITKRVKDLLHTNNVFTITNYYNQIFDNTEKQKYIKLPGFDGITLLSITSSNLHKNLAISIEIGKILHAEYPNFNFRFVFTVSSNQFNIIPAYLKKYFLLIGTVDISECPSLYEQSDIVFQPSLLECFTATYPEAMRMNKPIITTDLEFSRSLCGDAALYYDALSPEDAVAKIILICSDPELKHRIITNGTHQLKCFDTYQDRADKIIDLCHKIYNKKN